ncbi:MAG: chloride channel protein [Ilumatobacteraceae bacterium]|nr:chloride channel protein [Ilumatobacteraceae bacterium]
MATPTDLPSDPTALIRSPDYRRLLVIAAVVGLVVSVAAWAFLELVHVIQQGVYEDLPDALGFDEVPWWWPIAPLAIAGALAGFAIDRLPGRGGHIPYAGMSAGGTRPVELPGILLAAVATLGLGLVLGPEGPLIAASTGLAVLFVRTVRKDTPDQAMALLSAAAAFAAIASVFGSPVVGAVILIEAAALGGPTLPLILLPGLLSAGIGSLVFTGAAGWTGLDASDYALAPVPLPDFGTVTVAQIAWCVPLALAAAAFTAVVIRGARVTDAFAGRRLLVLLPVVGLTVAASAIVFGRITGEDQLVVLFSGQESFGAVFARADELSIGTLVALVVCKGIAWSLSLGGFRGGPTFPALFLGAVAGILCAHLPGLSLTPAVVILIAAMATAILRLPLSAVILTLILTAEAGTGTAPLAITSTVVAYVATLAIAARAERAPERA